MTARAYRPAPRGDGWLGGMRRVSPAAVHIAGCVLAFAAVLAGGIHLASAADWSGLAHSRALLAAAQMREADAQRVLTAAARSRGVHPVAARGDRLSRAPEWAALMLELADRAASSGLHGVSIEPQRADGAVPDGRRTVRIVADGGFRALLQMVGGLARFPVLAVPTALRVERGKAAARVEVSVDVFPGLPAATSTGGEALVLADAPGADPFGDAGRSEAEGAAARLAGTIRDGRAGLALFDDGDGAFAAVVPGEALGAARVVRVDPVTVTLATADGAYRVTLDDGRRP
ncbi:type IV pilus biogenesis protein PilP [Burkholderia aenigmatica]|uniref:pilus assembly protein n=1 Tax=Burkholderia cepacia complex TaxID=87882 RepID=UPI000F0774A8|nr:MULTISPECIES: pilus assembly protein [Burkholderia cepacia complex]AYQ36980.1 pilus assembly protein [Burkholderia lata]VWC56711.1 type IV pilus biogenesis protein PilP [Burkholderia aenigmatica]